MKFLEEYWYSLFSIRHNEDLDRKGKKKIGLHPPFVGSVKQRKLVKWIPPAEGWVKFNVDRACSEGSTNGGIGVVARDGSILLTSWRYLPCLSSAEEVEILACCEGLCLAAEWVRHPMVLEPNCSATVDILNHPNNHRSRFQFLAYEALKFAGQVQSFAVRHVKREQNAVAYELAQLAKHLQHSAVWPESFPTCVERLIAQDCILVVE